MSFVPGKFAELAAELLLGSAGPAAELVPPPSASTMLIRRNMWQYKAEFDEETACHEAYHEKLVKQHALRLRTHLR